mmetsp:Transcript_8005/g.11899  ORF Transcript_8005/g.11899 Transcript_8005/m.11899 type:complete len:770 (-) Transcript_8005:42-2351(-)
MDGTEIDPMAENFDLGLEPPRNEYDDDNEYEDHTEEDTHNQQQVSVNLETHHFAPVSGSEDEPVYQRLLNFGLILKMRQEKKRRDTGPLHAHTPSITRTAKKMRRKGTVEDLLLKRKDEYNAHVEELRRQREEEELKSMKEPKITDKSKNLKRDEPAYQRLYDTSKQTQAKHESMRKSQMKMNMANYKGKPHINTVSKKMQRSVDQIMEWNREKKRKAEIARKQRDVQEQNLCKRVKINPLSKRIARQMDRSPRVEEQLLRKHEESRMKREQVKRDREERDRMDAVPLISLHSASLRRDTSIFDRLYEQAKSPRRSTMRTNSPAMKRPSSARTSRDSSKYKPKINSRSSKMKRSIPVEDILQAKGQEMERKKREKRRQHELELQQNRYAKISPWSQVLVEVMESRTKQTTKDRLHKPIHTNKESTRQEIHKENLKNTYSPRINRNSRAIDRSSNGPIRDRRAWLVSKGEEYARNKNRLRAQYEAEKLQECTFQPRTSSPRRVTSNHAIAQRSQEWARRRRKRMEEERAQQKKMQMEECTFQPNRTSKSKRKVKRKAGNEHEEEEEEGEVERRPLEPIQQEQQPTAPRPMSARSTSSKGSSYRSHHRTRISRRSRPTSASSTGRSQRSARSSTRSSTRSRRQQSKPKPQPQIMEDDDDDDVQSYHSQRSAASRRSSRAPSVYSTQSAQLDEDLDIIRQYVSSETSGGNYHDLDGEHETTIDDMVEMERDAERQRLRDQMDEDAMNEIEATKFTPEANALLRDLLAEHTSL